MPEYQLPPEYRPFRELTLCSNVLVNVPVPILVGGRPALLVGQPSSPVLTLPVVWLAAPASPDSKEWLFVVESNRPLRPLIAVETDQKTGTVTVHVGGTLVLRAKQISMDVAIVDTLDLRPLGLLAYGSEAELHVGGTTLEHNRFENLPAAFSIGTEANRS